VPKDEFLRDLLQDPQVNAAFIDAQMLSDVGLKLTKCRRESGKTQLQIATQMGLTAKVGQVRALAMLEAFESGKRCLPLHWLQAYARAVGQELRLTAQDPSPNTAPYKRK
jgi:hypothetical protein